MSTFAAEDGAWKRSLFVSLHVALQLIFAVEELGGGAAFDAAFQDLPGSLTRWDSFERSTRNDWIVMGEVKRRSDPKGVEICDPSRTASASAVCKKKTYPARAASSDAANAGSCISSQAIAFSTQSQLFELEYHWSRSS